RRNIQRLAYREDLKFALDAFNKENLLAELEVEKVFSTNYRLVLDGNPTYVNLRAVWADDKRHLIVCVANVDVEIKRERDHAQKLRAIHEKAIRDELTGIRNQNAYAEFEETLLQAMESGMQQPFAMVVCDVNGLKEVNDSMGHKAGDEYIREACRLVCTVFDHSPVFRTGGDEFVAVLQGDDYHNRDVLLGSIRSTVLANQDNGGVIVAVGMSAYQPEIDERPSDVFSRADDLMYENKKTLKGARL
ncbi:MAG: GGDEF domain-containing protein, partial [Eggerthellaceae bacterium]|nr:GGDEF domain-containing protein [Eggerthellaceae bacterium]